jgi:hypothetical protein
LARRSTRRGQMRAGVVVIAASSLQPILAAVNLLQDGVGEVPGAPSKTIRPRTCR